MAEMFIRLNQDYRQIKSSLIGIHEDLELKKIVRGGDVHRQGRSVCILTFEGASSKKSYKVVYKPRNLEIDLAYEKFLSWANAYLKIPLNLVKMIARENYGWFEYISSKNCQTVEQIHRYYQRLGYLLGIVYLLIGSDIHIENVIVSDENPYIVDLKCLLVPIITSHEENELVIHSRFLVIDTLFLPRPQMVDADYKGFDVSAFGGMGGEKAPQKSLEPVNAGKDFMTVERKENYLNKTDNIPKFNDKEVNPADYQKDFINGFKEIYKLFIRQKKFLLSQDSPLNHFKNVETRFIVRNTAEYAKLLFESFHPLIFHSQAERNKHFNWLYREDSLEFINKFLESELRDLYEGNIPLFTILSDGKNVLDSYSNIMDVKIYQSGYQRMMVHLKNNIHNQDLQIQMNCIQQSLIAYQNNVKIKKSIARNKVKKIDFSSHLDFNQIKKDSSAVAKFQLDLLLRYEILDKNKICWTNIDYVDFHVWRPNRVATDLYNGLAGIILTFAYAEKIFKNVQYGDRSRIGFHYLSRIIRQLKNLDKITVGAFSGLSGILYCFSKLYHLWNDPTILEEVYFLLTVIKKLNATNEHYDLIDGASGLLAVFNTCKDVIPSTVSI